jgi:Protein of unknown function (DUF3147)
MTVPWIFGKTTAEMMRWAAGGAPSAKLASRRRIQLIATFARAGSFDNPVDHWRSPWSGTRCICEASPGQGCFDMMEWLLRFLIGGGLVAVFSLFGDVLRPKGFAGLFAAAPSVALASLVLTGTSESPAVASASAHSMIAGAIALGSPRRVIR